ncbi:hypothetical protein FI667_g10627, partial [Globisporangium splendens]
MHDPGEGWCADDKARLSFSFCIGVLLSDGSYLGNCTGDETDVSLPPEDFKFKFLEDPVFVIKPVGSLEVYFPQVFFLPPSREIASSGASVCTVFEGLLRTSPSYTQQTPLKNEKQKRVLPTYLRSLANISFASLYNRFLHEGQDAVQLDRKNHALRDAQRAMRIARLNVSGTGPPPLASLVTYAERAVWRREIRLIANGVQIKVLTILESRDAGTDNVGKRSRTGTVADIVRAWTKTVKHANA